MLMMLSSSLVLLAASPGQLALAMFSAMVFGLAYIPFMACALGQAVGSPVIGVLVDRLEYADAFSIFSVVGILVAVLSPLYPGHIDYLAEEEEPQPAEAEDTGLQAAYDHQLLDENGDPIKPVAEDAETS